MASRIAGITIEIGGDTTKLQSALKDVDKTLKSTQSSLRDVDKLLKFNPGNTELLTQKQKLLGKEINTTKERLETLKQAQAQMDAEGVDKTSDRYMALRREIIENEERLKSLNKEYKSFGSVAGQAVAAVGEKMKEVGKKITDFGKTWTTHVTAPLAALGVAGMASFAEVDKTMQLTNKTMNNTKEEAEALNKAMEEAAANSTFGMKEAAQATLNFARAGLDAAQAAAALAPAMNLAAGEGGNLETVSAGLVGTINGFGDSFKNTAHYADVFAAACNNSALDVDTLSDSMGVAAPVFRTAGRTVEDAALALGIMANANIDANTAANALKTGVMRLAAPTKQAAEAMAQFGIETSAVWTDSGQMKSVLEIQKNLHDSFAALSEQEQIAAASAIFGKNQGAAWLALINTAPAQVQELSDSISECSSVTDEMSEAMMGGFGGSIEKLKSSLDVLMTSLGRLLAEYAQPIIDKVQEWVDKFLALDDNTKKIIVTVGLVVAAIGPLLIIIGKIATGIGALLTLAPLLLSPVGLIIAAIVALIAAGIALYKNWDEIKEKAKAFWEGIKEGFERTKEDAVRSFERMKDGIANAWNGIKETASNTWNGIKEAITRPIESAMDTIRNLIDSIRNLFSGEISFPHIRMPHFTVNWRDLGIVKIPDITVEWYKKAYEQPYMFSQPTVVGNRGFGDGNGAEMVYGRDNLMRDIREAFASAQSDQPIMITVQSVLDGRIIGQSVSRYQRGTARAMGV